MDFGRAYKQFGKDGEHLGQKYSVCPTKCLIYA